MRQNPILDVVNRKNYVAAVSITKSTFDKLCQASHKLALRTLTKKIARLTSMVENVLLPKKIEAVIQEEISAANSLLTEIRKDTSRKSNWFALLSVNINTTTNKLLQLRPERSFSRRGKPLIVRLFKLHITTSQAEFKACSAKNKKLFLAYETALGVQQLRTGNDLIHVSVNMPELLKNIRSAVFPAVS